MRIQVLQHVPFEDAGSMTTDFKQRGYPVANTHWYRGDTTPALDSFDTLIVMGGPMGVYDEADHPWLAQEKALIKAAIDADKIILGVCLGAQLIACVLGAKVSRNPQREIGWFPLTLQTPPEQSPLGSALPQGAEVLHWHGDTFALPEGARWLASSEACAQQAFSMGDRIFGFQFHLETTEVSARALVTECADELDGSAFVQNPEEILAHRERFTAINKMMSDVLEKIFDA
jgi:GMP synthase-like glutamine amidotransferase